MPPNEGCRSCVDCWAGCGLGALAYNERIEFLRSPLALDAGVGLEAALVGRPGCALPKKSRPIRDS